jgi:hypothetical protein
MAAKPIARAAAITEAAATIGSMMIFLNLSTQQTTMCLEFYVLS